MLRNDKYRNEMRQHNQESTCLNFDAFLSVVFLHFRRPLRRPHRRHPDVTCIGFVLF